MNEGARLAWRERVEDWLLRTFYIGFTIVLLVPLLIVIVTSVNATRVITVPPDGVSLEWYGVFLRRSGWTDALWNSIGIAIGVSIVSTVVGSSAAFGLRGVRQRWTPALIISSQLPLLLPPVVIAITLIPFLSRLGLYQTYWGVIIAHSLWGIPMVFFIMLGVFHRFDWELWYAAMDLGASPARAFYEVMLPGIKPGLIASALVAFIVSLQEFVMALFLTGPDTRTLPVQTWTSLRQALEPTVSVASTVLIVVVIVTLILLSAIIGLERLARNLS